MSDISAAEAYDRHGIPFEILIGYALLRELPDGTLCGVIRLIFHYSIHVGIDYIGYRRKWCFGEFLHEPALALLAYDGGDDMPGNWRKDCEKHLYRDPETGITWPEDQPKPRIK